MGRLFNYDSPVMQWLQKVSEIIFCGLFWLICCLPVITAGASTTAMFRMMFNLREDKPASVGAFFRTFKKEFRQSTLLWLIGLLWAAVILLCFWLILLTNSQDFLMAAGLACFFILILGWMLTFSYAFPILSYFENTVGGTLKNALLMSVRHRKQTIPVLALGMIPVLGWMVSSYYFLVLLPLWVFFILPMIPWFQSHFLEKVFDEYRNGPADESNQIESD